MSVPIDDPDHRPSPPDPGGARAPGSAPSGGVRVRRPRHRPALVAAVALLVLGTVACAGTDDGATGSADAASASSVGDVPRSLGPVLPQGADPVELDPATFTTEIDNPYWPMVPGTRWRYLEIDDEGVEVEVTVVVTGETRRVANGITAVVVRDWVVADGELVEDTYDWYAQDAAGNLWYLGEDTVELEDGEVVTTAGSWEAGVDDALPGVLVPADPQPGMRYRQEYLAGEAEDNGEVLGVTEMAEVPAGSYTDGDLLLTKDTTTVEPDVLEYKLYAPGVGPVLTLGVSGGAGREELLSVDVVDTDGLVTELGSPPELG